MSDEEDYDSSEDLDYVPSDGEAVSEEENSGEEENLDALRDDGEPIKTGKRKRKPVKQKQSNSRKRVGGIKLEHETVVGEKEQDDGNKELEQQIKLEQDQKKQVQEKKRADDLWSSFMSDVGKRPEKKPAASTGLGSLSSSIKKPTPTKPTVNVTKACVEEVKPTGTVQKSTITVTKVYDFAGEAVKVTKEIDVNSKEGKEELKKQQEGAETSTEAEDVSVKTTSLGVKRPGVGLGGVLAKINKKPKIGTLEKSKIDWEEFKEKEGIDEELKIHNRGKQSYIERMNFLQRSDQRQFEIEKSPTPTKPTVNVTKACVEEVKPTGTVQKSTITVTKVYDFAGEAVKVTKEIDVNSKEGKEELKKQQEGAETSTEAEDVSVKTTSLGVKRPGVGLGGVLAKINKKPKIGTLEKSKIDWEEFKEKEGIDEELKIHNRGKQSYIERMNFLQRSDQRQFEIEKSVRLSSSSKR